MKRTLEVVITKLLKVIDSIDRYEHIQSARNYIDLYYEMYGLQNKGIIEIYFRSKKEKFI
jgi:hypothetical protein|tara:strand:- start:356 stop:535 length:180 start_codon:yes stop_codon:yes gene_type:complete